MQTSFLSVALNNLSLFQSGGSSNLLQAITGITGISVPELLHAERRIQKSGSMDPLRDLLTNPNIQRAEKFQFRIGMKQIHKGRSTAKEQVASRFRLEISTARGRIDIEIMMLVKRKFGELMLPSQSAQIQMNYTVHQGNQVRTHTQNLNIADRAPAWRPARHTEQSNAAAFAA